MEPNIHYNITWQQWFWEEWHTETISEFDSLEEAEKFMSTLHHENRTDMHIEKVTTTYERVD